MEHIGGVDSWTSTGSHSSPHVCPSAFGAAHRNGGLTDRVRLKGAWTVSGGAVDVSAGEVARLEGAVGGRVEAAGRASWGHGLSLLFTGGEGRLRLGGC